MKLDRNTVGNTVKKLFNEAAAHPKVYLAVILSAYAATAVAAVITHGSIMPDPVFNTPSPDVVDSIKHVCSCGDGLSSFITDTGIKVPINGSSPYCFDETVSGLIKEMNRPDIKFAVRVPHI